MLRAKLKDYKIILASGSPRRQDLFDNLDIDFSIDVRELDESYLPDLKGIEITDHLARLKATAFDTIETNEIIITSDTLVWKDYIAIGKPANQKEAKEMLRNLSGEMHEVITSVCFTSKDFQKVIHDTTKVWFKKFTEDEIDYYLKAYKPFDKAGSYGVQEWLGLIGIDRLEGSYFNVMGLPTRLVYKTLMEIADG
jgi:nucleoside triphosphate pyrophosphatase